MNIATNDTFLQLGTIWANVRLTREAFLRPLLVSGVTGSGKTTTAKVIAEAASAQGVAIFAIDAKGDFAGISQTSMWSEHAPRSPPITLWDTAGEAGQRFSLRRPPRADFAAVVEGLFETHPNGVGRIGILHAPKLVAKPAAYAAFLYELISQLADVSSAPGRAHYAIQLLVIIEEAHLLFRHLPPGRFRDLSNALKRLTSGPVTVLFIASHPADLPEEIDSMVGVRIQHALWTLSPTTLARTRRDFGGQVGEDTVRGLGIGEALVVSMGVAGRTAIRVQVQRPNSRDGPITQGERRSLVAAAPTSGPPLARRDPAIWL